MKIKASFKISMLLILGIGVIGSPIITYYLFIPMLKHKYVQIVDLSLTLIALIVGLSSIYYILKNEVIHIDKKKLKRTAFFGLVKEEFQMKDLESYTAIQKSNKYINWEDLDLYFHQKKVRITSSNLKKKEYLKLKAEITKLVKENVVNRNRWQNRDLQWWGIGFMLIWTVLIGIIINQFKTGNKIIDNTNTYLIEGIITNDVKRIDDNRKSAGVILELNTFPSFSFRLNNPEINALDFNKFQSEISKGEKVTIKIWQGIYEKKILESRPVNFREKHFNYHFIDILGLTHKNHDYMTEQIVNRARKKFHTKGNFYGLMTFGLFGLGVGIYLLILSLKPDTNMQ